MEGTTKGQASSLYEYAEIESAEIRCITLSSDTDQLACHLNVCTRDEGGYCALSYEWGAPTPGDGTNVIITQDGSVSGSINVTENLKSALLDLKTSSLEPKAFFVDQISINQNNGREKSVQVSNMGDVYRHAETVLTYLGPAEDGDKSAIHLLQRVGDHFGQWYDEWDGESDILGSFSNIRPFNISESEVKALRDLQNILYIGGWIKRLWMTQEILLSKELMFLRGSSLIPSRFVFIFTICSTFCMITGIDDKPEPGHTHAITMSIFRRIIEVSDNVFAYVALIDSFGSRFDCNDPRDIIYALLGLARNAFDVEPDYDLEVVDVFTDFTEKAINGMRTLRIFDYVFQPSNPLQVPHKSTPGEIWPTWVPAFEQHRRQGPIHMATGSTIPIFTCESDERAARKMLIRGHQVDTVVKVFVHFGPGPNTSLMTSTDCDILDNFLGGIDSIVQHYLDNGREDIYTMICHTLFDGDKSISSDYTDAEWATHAGTALSMTLDSLREAQHTSIEGQKLGPSSINLDTSRASLIEKMLTIINVDNSCLCLTRKGNLVKSPGAVEPDDVIVVFFGGAETYSLRPDPTGTFQLLGPCYTLGHMNAEILHDDEWEESLRVIAVNALEGASVNIRMIDMLAPVSTEDEYQNRIRSSIHYLVGCLFVSRSDFIGAFSNDDAAQRIITAAQTFRELSEDQQRHRVREMIKSPPFIPDINFIWRDLLWSTVDFLIDHEKIRAPKWRDSAKTFQLV